MTVAELKDHVVAVLGVPDFYAIYRVSPELWRKLNHLGGRGMPPRDEDMPPDIDEAARVTDEEVREILREAAAIRAAQ